MLQVSPESLLATRITRRTALQGAVAAGLAGAFAARGLPALARQDAATYPELVIVARDYSFELPETIEGGWTTVTLDNQGEMDHHAMFMRVNDGAAVEDVQAALMEPSFGAMFAVSTSVGGPMAGPGAKASVIVNLEPGSYVLICAIPGPEGLPHYAMGMQTVLEVTAATAEAEEPVADATVQLMEMMFHGIEGQLATGAHLWEVANVGSALHEMAVLRLAEGVTFEQVQAMLLTPPEATPMDHSATPAAVAMDGPPPMTVIGGVAPMNPGFTNYLPLQLEAGEYFAICFVPDEATGAPHAALGMIMPFSVA